MPTIDVRIDEKDLGLDRYIYNDSGDFLYMMNNTIYHCDSTGGVTGLCDMTDLPMLIKAIERIRDDNQPA